jgi:hypothetical protein
LGEIQFEKNGRKKWKGGKVFIFPLGGVEIFQGLQRTPRRVLGTREGCFKTFKEYCKKKIFGRACQKPLQCIKGFFEWVVMKG